MNNITQNKNLLSPNGFKIVIDSKEFANLEYFITKASLPSLSIGEVSTQFRNRESFLSGNNITYENLSCTFAVDEDLKNYKEVFGWLESNRDGNVQKDIRLIIYSSHNNINKTIVFRNAFPVSLGGVDFDTQTTGVDYLKTDVSFKYDYFIIE